jgi:hypothetical protein
MDINVQYVKPVITLPMSIVYLVVKYRGLKQIKKKDAAFQYQDDIVISVMKYSKIDLH